MTHELQSIVGGGSRPGGADPAEILAQRHALSASHSHAGTIRFGKPETPQAVKPTPVTAEAAKVDFAAEKRRGDTVFEYPVFGPDRFARVSAERAIEEAEARSEAIRARTEAHEAEEIDVVDEVAQDPAAEELQFRAAPQAERFEEPEVEMPEPVRAEPVSEMVEPSSETD